MMTFPMKKTKAMCQTTNQIVFLGKPCLKKKTCEIPYRERRVYSNHENNGTWGWFFLLGLTSYFFLAIPSIAASQQLKRLLNGSAEKLLYDHTMTYKHLNSDFLWVMANAS